MIYLVRWEYIYDPARCISYANFENGPLNYFARESDPVERKKRISIDTNLGTNSGIRLRYEFIIHLRKLLKSENLWQIRCNF